MAHQAVEAVYPIVYFDAMMVKIREDRSVRSRACYLAVGVTVEGDREALSIWWQDSEGLPVLARGAQRPHRRGVRDVPIASGDGLAGFPKAIEAVFPAAWVQTCIVHQIRGSLRYVPYKKVGHPPFCVDATRRREFSYQVSFAGPPATRQPTNRTQVKAAPLSQYRPPEQSCLIRLLPESDHRARAASPPIRTAPRR